MKVAITGANGFVGRAVLRHLAARGDTAAPIVRSPSGLPGEIVAGDLAGAALDGSALAGIDAVIHLAARTHVIVETAPDVLAAYRSVNVEGTRTIVDAAIAAGARRFVFMSSVKAAGERSAPGNPITPETPPAPEDAYGVSKLEAEGEVRARCEAAGVEWTIIRPPLVYGPGVKANFARMMAMIAKGVPLPLGSVRNRRSIVYVDNLAEAAVAACTAPGAANRVLMIADATLSTPELLREIAAAQGSRLRLLPFPPGLLKFAGRLLGRGGEIQRLCGSLEIDARSSMKALDWQPTHELAEAMRATVRS